jgi:hypothetical protein
MNLFSPISVVYWLATPARLDRQAHMQELLDGHGVYHQKLVGEKPLDKEGFRTRGLRGNYESHLNAVIRARAENHPSVLVLEDDVVFKNIPMLRAVVAELTEYNDWDMFYFYPGKLKLGGLDLQRIAQAKAVNYGHAQAISRKAYDMVIEILTEQYEVIRKGGGDPRHSDVTNVYQEFIHPYLRVFCAKEALIVQDPQFGSDTLTE